MDAVKTFYCIRCDFQTRQFWRLLKHYESQHSADARFRVLCGINNCPKTYHNVKALCAHMRLKHGSFYEKNVVAAKHVRSAFATSDCADIDHALADTSLNGDVSADVISDQCKKLSSFSLSVMALVTLLKWQKSLCELL